MVASVSVHILTFLTLYPSTISHFSTMTSIQMLKDSDIVLEVAREQSLQRSERAVQIYKGFKLIRHDLIYNEKADVKMLAVKPLVKGLLRENFDELTSRVKNQDNLIQYQSQLDIDKFYNNSSMFGKNVDRFDSIVLYSYGKCDKSMATLPQLITGVQKFTNDVTLNPYSVVKDVFKYKFKATNKIKHIDICKFFEIYNDYFEKSDIDAFINDLLISTNDKSEYYIDHIAMMIKEGVECYPR